MTFPQAMFAAAGLAVWAASGHASLMGDPPHTRLVPDLDVFPQNFSVAQDRASILYVGNTEGVLTFDGERWELVPLPNGDLVRALAFDGKDRVYVGGFDQFGYLARDATGRETFHDLTPAFAAQLADEAFADIWDIHVAPAGVFFRALRHVFLYEPATGRARMWRHDGRLGAITQHEGRTLLQFRGEGLRAFAGDEWVPVAGGEALKEQIWDFLPLPGGGLLMLAADGSWRQFRDGRVSAFAVPDGFPKSSSFSSGTVLGDGTLALTSDDGLLYFFDPRAATYRSVRIDPGYLARVIRANDGGLLVAGEDSVYHVEWPAPWTLLGAAQGLYGSLHSVTHWNGSWYALTASGVQRLIRREDGTPAFKRVDWANVETWELLPLDARTALLAASYRVHLIRDGAAHAITHSAFYPRVLRRSRFDPDVVFVGREPGFAVLRRRGDEWRLRLEAEGMQDARVLDIVETAPRELWLGSERGGIWRLRLSDDYSRVVESSRFGVEQGLEYGELVGGSVNLLPEGTMLATTEKGIFHWRDGRFEKITLDGLESARDRDEWLSAIVAGPQGRRWAYSYRHIYHAAPGQDWRREPLGSLRRGAVEALTFDDAGAAVFSTSYSILRHHGAAGGSAGAGAPVTLRAVERVAADGTRVRLGLDSAGRLEAGPHDAAIEFRFALPDYRRPEAVRYQARLAGLDERFPDWSANHTLTYSRLPPGDYVLEVRGQDSLGRITELAPFAFSVSPVWYESAWARALWLLLAGVALAGSTLALAALRTRRLAAEKLRLERQVAQRTRELRAANRRLETMAHLDGLTGVANRRRLDDYLAQAWSLCAENRTPLAVLAIDVDRFKTFNDSHGHLAGDDVLVKLVQVAAACLMRDEELVARYGGDEFFVVLPDTGTGDAWDLAERIRQGVEAAEIGATVSIGVAAREPHLGGEVEDLVKAADRALYNAKAGGRNRVAVGKEKEQVAAN